ncbi:MAG: hypothetical protein GYB67_15105 [Chloroflexi bacterium]|nr:hypothetical protein [Chloroflexota bacterium]
MTKRQAAPATGQPIFRQAASLAATLRRLRPSHLLALIVGVQVAVGLGYAFATPLWQGHEPDYYHVIRFLHEQRRLPTVADYPDGDAYVRQATQPPLYFFLAYPIIALADDGQPVPPGTHPNAICFGGEIYNDTLITYPTTAAYDWPPAGAVTSAYMLRLLNILLGVGAVIFTYQAGRTLFPERQSVALLAAALLAFEPNLARLNSTISNDTLLLTIAAANLLVCARLIMSEKLRWRYVMLVLITAALALLTRLAGWAVFASSVFALIFVVGRSLWLARTSGQLRVALIGFGLLIVAGIAIGLFNYGQYGSFFGRYSELDTLAGNIIRNFTLPWITIVGVLDHTRLAYLEPLTPLNPRAAVETGYTWLAIIGLIGGLWLGIDGLRQRSGAILRAFTLLLIVVAVTVVMVIARNLVNADDTNTTLYNTGFIFAPMRYYATGLPALALLMSAGLLALIPRRLPLASLNPLASLIALTWFGVSMLGIIGLLIAHPAPTTLTARQYDDARAASDTIHQPNQTSASGPSLLGYQLVQHPADGLLDLTLYASTRTALEQNYVIQIDMESASGQTTSCQFVPTRGVYPTTRWQPDEIVVAQARIPSCAATFPAPIEVTMRWLGASMDGEFTQTSAPISLGTLTEPLTRAATCADNLGVIDDGYQIVKFNSPPEVPRDAVYLPSLNWLVLAESPRVDARFFVFTHQATQAAYTCTGAAGAEIYQPRLWQRGEAIYFDLCRMQFPTDAPLGVYTVSVGMEDTDGQRLPAGDPDGQPLADRLVPVGTLTLTD